MGCSKEPTTRRTGAGNSGDGNAVFVRVPWRRASVTACHANANGMAKHTPTPTAWRSIRIANPRATSELVVPPEICLRARVTWGDRTTAGSRVDLTARGLGSRSDAVRSCVACVCVSECVCGVNT
jgi:hypothetical protein